jgi:hypothetical protein
MPMAGGTTARSRVAGHVQAAGAADHATAGFVLGLTLETSPADQVVSHRVVSYRGRSCYRVRRSCWSRRR